MSIAIVAESTDSLDAGDRVFRRDGDVFEGQRRTGPAEAAQHLVLESLDVDLAEVRVTVPRAEFVTGAQIQLASEGAGARRGSTGSQLQGKHRRVFRCEVDRACGVCF